MIAQRIELVVLAVGVILVATYLYLRLGERAIQALPEPWSRRLTSVLFVGPAASVLGLALVIPAVITIVLSLFSADSSQFVGIANYVTTLSDGVTRVALRNTVLWVLLLPISAVVVGLAIAVLTDRLRYGQLIKAALFLPIAISAVAGGVIWTFMYDYQPEGAAQTGTLNAIITSVFDTSPVAWIVDEATNNFALIAATLWTQAGFAMVIFSAALRSIPDELYEAARLDGASEWAAFRHITLPMIAPTVLVVATTMTIVALKAFDIVYVMTNGQYGTDVLSTVMYRYLFVAKDNGVAGAVATILMIAVIPVMIFNLRQYRRETTESPVR